MKGCTICNIQKPLEKFYSLIAHNGKKYPSSCCVDCNSLRAREYRQTHREEQRSYEKRLRQSLRQRVLNHYGELCVHCGTKSRLEVDHINNDGKKFRQEVISGASKSFYYWIINNSFPEDLQILCKWCNLKKEYERRKASI